MHVLLVWNLLLLEPTDIYGWWIMIQSELLSLSLSSLSLLSLISNFRHVVNVVCFLLGNSPASEFRRQGITQKKTYNIVIVTPKSSVCTNFLPVLLNLPKGHSCSQFTQMWPHSCSQFTQRWPHSWSQSSVFRKMLCTCTDCIDFVPSKRWPPHF
jgi:hypothetical protein